MRDKRSRRKITETVGRAVDELVADLYSETTGGVSAVQETEITSRLCQRLEDRLDKQEAGGYVFRVIAQSLPDRGPNSMEKLIGADIFLSVSLEGSDGFDKGVFIQAKYDRSVDRGELKDACDRMKKVADSDSVYVWVYEPDGVRVVSSHQVNEMQDNSLADTTSRSVKGFFGRILDCYAGSKTWGIPDRGNRRQEVGRRLREARARRILDIKLEKSKGQTSLRAR